MDDGAGSRQCPEGESDVTKVMDQRETNRPIMSVIVPTMNRAHILETICLASLATQELAGRMELIVCDASLDTATETVVQEWSSAHPEWVCTYVHATKRGSCSQRNQAIRLSHGTLLLFLDDDLELLPGALVALVQAFDRDANCEYGGFECTQVLPSRAQRSGSTAARLAHRWFAGFWGLGTDGGPKRILPTGFNTGGGGIDHETASALRRAESQVTNVEWMSGCCMAFRASLLRDRGIRFNERLERFGGYAVAEDVTVSLSVRREVGLRLGQCSNAQAIHREAPGGRGDDRPRWAARAYNLRIVWRLAGKPTLPRRFNWLRGQVGSAMGCLGRRRMDRLQGLVDGWRAIRLDETRGHLLE